MSSAALLAKCSIRFQERDGHDSFGQRQAASSAFSFTSLVPHSGQFAGILKGFSEPARSFTSGSMTSGIMSPALWTMTVSPTRIPLRATSPSLCRVAICTVEPAMTTGSNIATGVAVPVRPMDMKMSLTLVAACSAAYFMATAPRGALPTTPRRR